MKVSVGVIFIICVANADTSKTTSPSNVCKNINISLTQKINNEGFHRELNWLLERNPESLQCKLAITLTINKEMFVNPDEIADLNRLRFLSMLIDGDVDVEAPAHLAAEHTVYIFLPPHKEKVSLIIPFHLRYQRAQISGGFGKVVVNKPSMLALCPEGCSKTEVMAPCDISNRVKCGWNNVSYEALFDEVELLVPVGDLDDYPLVSIVTSLLGCAGCIYALSVSSMTPL